MFSEELSKISWDDTTSRINVMTAHDVEVALSKEVLSVDDFMALISPAAIPYLETMAQRAQHYTQERFGKVISMYIPLFITQS